MKGGWREKRKVEFMSSSRLRGGSKNNVLTVTVVSGRARRICLSPDSILSRVPIQCVL